MLKQSN